MSDKSEIPQIMENVTDDRFGMCPICNKAKWCHTNDEKVSCNIKRVNSSKSLTILTDSDLSDIKKEKVRIKIKFLF